MALLSYSPSFFSLISSLNVTFSMCGAKRELQHADTMCACKTVAGWRPKLHPAVPYTVHHQMVQKSEICTIQLNKASNAKDHYIAFVVSQTQQSNSTARHGTEIWGSLSSGHKCVFAVSVGLSQTGDLSAMFPASCPTTAGRENDLKFWGCVDEL